MATLQIQLRRMAVSVFKNRYQMFYLISSSFFRQIAIPQRDDHFDRDGNKS